MNWVAHISPYSEDGPGPADPGFGQMYGCGPQPSYLTPDGVYVWMWRKGQRCRYYDSIGQQVGPEHKNVVPAIIWAGGNCWIDPSAVMLSIGVIAEVRYNSRWFDEKNPDAGAWRPIPKPVAS